MKKQNIRRKKAVAPVLATLLMIAVAVAMSVIIFMWSQGFLSQTSESTGSQQGAQNQAAQSSVAIETITFSGTTATVYFRNVGSVSITPALLTAQGISSNSGFTGTATNSTNLTSGSIAKGAGSSNAMTLSGLAAGDVVSFKITTTAGTFAQGTFTVP
jgi:FlaG/FlaF family flagellin (archaellin)